MSTNPPERPERKRTAGRPLSPHSRDVICSMPESNCEECARLAEAERTATAVFVACERAADAGANDPLAFRRIAQKAETAYRDLLDAREASAAHRAATGHAFR